VIRVLIVEDDPSIGCLLEDVLSEEGYSTELVINGQRALEVVRDRCPHVILMDLMMPVLDGVTATRLLKSDPKTKDIPVIAMSAGTNLRLHAEHLPADGALPKPFDLDAVLMTVSSVLRQPHARNRSDLRLGEG
jgi:CheY-like chemotaxis protein